MQIGSGRASSNFGVLQPLSQAQPIFKHGHDLFVDSAGDIYLGEWNADRRYPSKLTLVR